MAAGDAPFDHQPMTEDDFEITALRLFPEEAEIILEANDDRSFAYGYLDREFPETLIELLKEWTNHMQIWKYCRFMELVWEKGDPYMRNALAVTVIEALGCYGGDIWIRFGYYLSDAFRAWINNEAVPGNIMFNHGRRLQPLTALCGKDLPAKFFPEPCGNSDDSFPGNEVDPFMLGSYHILDGRITRYLGYPERLQSEVKNLTWADIDSGYHRVTFENENGRKDCFHIIFSHFPAGYLRTHIVEAFCIPC